MKNKRKGREVFQAPSYWQSYSDMMAALLLLFVLIIAITLGIYKMNYRPGTGRITIEQYPNRTGRVRERTAGVPTEIGRCLCQADDDGRRAAVSLSDDR